MPGSLDKVKDTIWKTQIPIDYLNDALVQNAWDTVSSDLSEGDPARLQFIIIEQTNNGATGEAIELEITINGTAYTFSATINSGTQYYACITYNKDTGDFECYLSSSKCQVGAQISTAMACPFVAESVGLIRARQTSGVDGTSAQIEVNVHWEKKTSV